MALAPPSKYVRFFLLFAGVQERAAMPNFFIALSRCLMIHKDYVRNPTRQTLQRLMSRRRFYKAVRLGRVVGSILLTTRSARVVLIRRAHVELW